MIAFGAHRSPDDRPATRRGQRPARAGAKRPRRAGGTPYLFQLCGGSVMMSLRRRCGNGFEARCPRWFRWLGRPHRRPGSTTDYAMPRIRSSPGTRRSRIVGSTPGMGHESSRTHLISGPSTTSAAGSSALWSRSAVPRPGTFPGMPRGSSQSFSASASRRMGSGRGFRPPDQNGRQTPAQESSRDSYLAGSLGAREKTRTSTSFRKLAPEASASTNSATRAGADHADIYGGADPCQRHRGARQRSDLM